MLYPELEKEPIYPALESMGDTLPRGFHPAPVVAGLESIDYQNGAFFEALLGFYIDCRAAKVSTHRDLIRIHDDYAANLAAIIKMHTKLVVLPLFDTNDGPSIGIPDINRNHVLMEDWMRGFWENSDGRKIIRDAGGFAKGSVDRKNSKVHGFFTKINPTLYMPAQCVFGHAAGWSPEELAAITLHEVGHLFTYCEYIAYTTRVSLVLSGVSKELDKSLPAKEIEIVFAEAKRTLNLKALDEQEVSVMSDRKAQQTVLLTAAIKCARDELGYDIYSESSWEFLADDFAIRHGAGRYIVTALAKFYIGGKDTRSNAMFYVIEACRAVAFIAGIVVAVLVPVAIVHVLVGISFLISTGTMDGTTYDRPLLRFKRARNGLMNRLRDKNISKEMAKQISEDVRYLDRLLVQFNDNVPLFSAIGALLVRSWGKRIEGERVTKELEGLVANRLWLSATELKHQI